MNNAPSSVLCRGLYIYESSGSYLAGWQMADVILLLRTWAIWKNDRRVGICLAAAFLMNFAATGVLLHRYNSSLVYSTAPFLAFNVCFTASEATSVWPVFAAQCVLEAGILGLTIMKGIQHWNSTSRLLMSTLYRDGLLFTSFTLMSSLVNMALLNALDVHVFPMTQVGITLQRVVHSVLCCRIILHLRKASASPQDVKGARALSPTDNSTLERGNS